MTRVTDWPAARRSLNSRLPAASLCRSLAQAPAMFQSRGSNAGQSQQRGGGGGGRGGAVRGGPSRADAPMAWAHDRFFEGGAAPAAPAAVSRPPLSLGVKLFVSGLTPDVTDKDVHDLFSNFGEVRSIAMNYGSRGPTSSCEVTMRNAAQAELCIAELHQRQVDNMILKVRLAEAPKAVAPPAPVHVAAPSLLGGMGVPGERRGGGMGGPAAAMAAGGMKFMVRPNGGAAAAAGGRVGAGAGGRGGAAGGAARPPKPVSSRDLDNALDSYKKGGAAPAAGGAKGPKGPKAAAPAPAPAASAEELDAALEAFKKGRAAAAAAAPAPTEA